MASLTPLTREELVELKLDKLQALAIRLGIKTVGSGWSKCCPPTGHKADIINAICGQSAPRRANINSNINSIGRASSGRLAAVLTRDLADAVLLAKITRDFKDFNDLQQRVRGIGPVKIEELKQEGFRVEQRQAAAV